MNTFSINHLEVFDWSKSPQKNRFTEAYTAFYHLDFPNILHTIGSINLANYTIAAQLFTPNNSSAVVIILHGYFDHGAMMRNCIRLCLDQGFSVAVLDLPGHGLSSGKRASIIDFSEYAQILDRFVNLIRENLKLPVHFIGHSTGCSAALEWMYSPDLKASNYLEKIVFIAPLVRCTGQNVFRVLSSLLNHRIKSVPAFYHPTTSNPQYELFRKNDPLRPCKIPLSWVDAEINWYCKMRNRGFLDTKICILQGTSDRVVDWKFNLRFLEKKICHTEINLFEQARHQLHNEREDLRIQVFEVMKDFFER